jgi:hypothetical protein
MAARGPYEAWTRAGVPWPGFGAREPARRLTGGPGEACGGHNANAPRWAGRLEEGSRGRKVSETPRQRVAH